MKVSGLALAAVGTAVVLILLGGAAFGGNPEQPAPSGNPTGLPQAGQKPTVIPGSQALFGGGWYRRGGTAGLLVDPVNPTALEARRLKGATRFVPGVITVVKKLVPSSDGGRFNLMIDGIVLATEVGDAGSTGPVGLASGSHVISDIAVDPANQADYASSVACTSGGELVAAGPGPNLVVILEPGEQMNCVVSNLRRPGEVVVANRVRDGLEGRFHFSGTLDGEFDLLTGSSRTFRLPPGNYRATQEVVAGVFSVDSIECSDSNDAAGRSTVTKQSALVSLQSGEVVTCIFANSGSGLLPAVAGSAKISAAAGCVAEGKPLVSVSGAGISEVSFYIGDKLIGRVAEPSTAGNFELRYSIGRLEVGRTPIVAKVSFGKTGTPPERTLTTAVFRCPSSTEPDFVG